MLLGKSVWERWQNWVSTKIAWATPRLRTGILLRGSAGELGTAPWVWVVLHAYRRDRTVEIVEGIVSGLDRSEMGDTAWPSNVKVDARLSKPNCWPIPNRGRAVASRSANHVEGHDHPFSCSSWNVSTRSGQTLASRLPSGMLDSMDLTAPHCHVSASIS